jgi:hypothetical protein
MLGLTWTGFFIVYAANSRENRGQYWTHMALAGAMPLIYVDPPRDVGLGAVLGPRLQGVRRDRGGRAAQHRHPRADAPTGKRASGVADRGTAIATVPKDETLRQKGLDPFVPFRGFQEVPKTSRFFPSAATTATGNWMASAVVTARRAAKRRAAPREVKKYGFVKDTLIGAITCKRCTPTSSSSGATRRTASRR